MIADHDHGTPVILEAAPFHDLPGGLSSDVQGRS